MRIYLHPPDNGPALSRKPAGDDAFSGNKDHFVLEYEQQGQNAETKRQNDKSEGTEHANQIRHLLYVIFSWIIYSCRHISPAC